MISDIRFRPLAILMAAALFVTACDDDDDDAPAVVPQQTILQLAQANSNLDILEAAVGRAGSDISNALSGAGPLTVFAPTDDAFRDYVDVLNGAAARPTEAEAITAINGLTPAAVAGILRYHVLSGRVAASAVPANAAVNTLAAEGATNNAGRVFVRNSNGVRVNNATVVTADVEASNGIVHVIDAVLVPPTQNIGQIAVGNDDLDLLVAALNRATGLFNAITGPGPLTVFAPTDQAFINLVDDINGADPAPDEAGALAAINALPLDQLTAILQAHVLAGNTVAYAADVPTAAANLNTLNSARQVTVQRTGAAVTVRGAGTVNSNVTIANITATNGVVHVIDRVIRTS